MSMQRLLPFLSILALFAFWPSSADAQELRSPGDIGVGGQIGTPSGITAKIYNPGGISYEFLAAWDLGDLLFFNVHGLHERHIGDTERAHFFFGPGAYIGFRDTPDAVLGVSATGGISFMVMPLEFYAQVTPRLDLAPSTAGQIGGGVGIRYYF